MSYTPGRHFTMVNIIGSEKWSIHTCYLSVHLPGCVIMEERPSSSRNLGRLTNVSWEKPDPLNAIGEKLGCWKQTRTVGLPSWSWCGSSVGSTLRSGGEKFCNTIPRNTTEGMKVLADFKRSFIFFFFHFLKFYWSIVDLQYCHNFYCTLKYTVQVYLWFTYTCTHTHSLSDSFPTEIITEYWTENSCYIALPC